MAENTNLGSPPTSGGAPVGGMGDPADFPGMVSSDGAPPKVDTGMGSRDDFPGVRSDTGSGFASIAQGVVKGAVEGTGMSAGAITGFKAAMRLPIPHPGAKAVAVGLATVGGGLYGMFAGGKATGALSELKTSDGTPITYRTLADVPPKERSAFILGENLGMGISFTGTTVGLAKTGARILNPSYIGKVLNSIMSDARDKTARHVIIQTTSAIGSGLGGGFAEAIAPGSLGTRVTGEVIGGVVPLGRLVAATGSFAMNRFAGFRRMFSPAARETAAARLIQDAYATSGGDIVIAQRVLANSIANHPDLPATVAQRLGDDAMIGLEKALVSESHKVSIEVATRAEATVRLFRDSIALLRGSGAPEAVKQAGEMERRYFTLLMTSRLNTIRKEATDAAAELTRMGSGNRTELSMKVYAGVEEALVQTRAVEKVLWDAVPGAPKAGVDFLALAFKALDGLSIRSEALPKTIVDEMALFVKDGGVTTVGYLKQLRSFMLRRAREIGSDPARATEATMYGRMAEAALDDINAVFKNGDTSGVLRAMGFDPDAYDKARGFTAALHAAFTNSFTGKNLAEGAKGLRLAPEALMARAFAGGPEVTSFRLAELAESTRFLTARGMGGAAAEDNIQLVLEAQRSYFAIAAAELAGVKTGDAKIVAIERFISKNPELEERFPEVIEMMRNAAKTQADVDALASLHKHAGKMTDQRAAWGKLSGTKADVLESPVDAVAKILSGNTPKRSLTALAKMAAKRDVVAGFQATVFDHAIRDSTSPSGQLDFAQFRRVLFDPVRPGMPSVLDIMTSTGTFDNTSRAALITILDEADTLIKAQTTTGAFVETEGVVSFLGRAIAKIVGSRIATTTASTVSGEAGGASIVIAAAGANLGDRILNAIPAGKVKDLLIEAIFDEDLMLLLMRKPVGEAKILKHARELHAVLISLGAVPVQPLALGGGDFVSEMVN